MHSRKYQKGVNLIELMIVVTIVAILGAIAYPSYRNQLMRSHRSEAKAALLQIQVAQEKWFLQNNAYTNTLIQSGCDITDDEWLLRYPCTIGVTRHDVRCHSNAATAGKPTTPLAPPSPSIKPAHAGLLLRLLVIHRLNAPFSAAESQRPLCFLLSPRTDAIEQYLLRQFTFLYPARHSCLTEFEDLGQAIHGKP